MPSINVLVEGGKASAAPPLGPALGPLGVNITEVVAQINEKTKQFAGMRVPVKVIVDSATKKVEIEVGSPPATALIKKVIGTKGAQNPKTEQVGNLTMEQVVDIAKKKVKNMEFKALKGMVKQILGTCNSMGVTVEGKKARTLVKAVDSGAYDSLIEQALSKTG
jgi:large subunit ribosomal protein L11